MAGRGRGGRGAKLFQALQRLKMEEEQEIPAAGSSRQEGSATESGTSASEASASQSEASAPPSEPQSEASAPPSEPQSDASAPPSDASGQHSEASEQSASETGSQASSPTPSSPRSPSPKMTLGGRGKLRKYLTKRTPPDTPRSRTPDSSDATSTCSENQSQSSEQSDQRGDSPSSGSSPQPPTEPEPPTLRPIENKVKGTEGRELQVSVNYMRLRVKPSMGVHLYHVFFEPNIDSIYLRRKALHSPEVLAKIGDTQTFTGTNLFLPRRLESSLTRISAAHPTTPSVQISITIQYIKQPPHDELIQFYNNLFNRIMRELKLVQMNLHHYDPLQRTEIPAHKLEVWPGHICAIQEFDGGLMLNCDTSHRVLRTTTARDMLRQLYQTDSSRFKDAATRILVGSIVLTRYNNKPYRVDDIDFSQNPTSKFSIKEGQQITYIEYFKRQWNIDIRDNLQPLLIHRPKPKRGQTEAPMVCLIPELSYMTGLTDDIRSDKMAMKDLASHTRMKPAVKYAKLVEFIRRVNTHPGASKVLSDWGIELCDVPVTAGARQMQPEKLLFGRGKEIQVSPHAEWGGDVRNSACLSAIMIERWVMVHHSRDATKAEEFVRMLQQVTRNMGFSFANPRRVEIRDENAVAYVTAIKESTAGAQLVVLMTPGSSQREDRYAAIKRLCCADLGLPSQVVRANTLSGNKMRAVCQNIALQICCKQGGQLWSVSIPLPNAMIIGLDSYHDPVNKSRSVVGVVSSINRHITRWYSRCYFQTRREEIVNTLRAAMTTALRKYHELNSCLPNKIFIFRDGVGDGDLAMVRDYEIPQIEEAIEAFIKANPSEKPTLSFVVVQKRINMKMLLKRGNDFDNPPPGTVIDHTVTRRQFYDFYLVSQHVNQGTVTPTHYISLYDQNNLGPDKMQKLSYKLTHLYYNFPSTIRVPAPCQYAHKLAFLMGQYVKKEAKESLADKLYFL